MKPTSVLVGCLFALAALATSATASADREIGLGISYDPRLPVGGLGDLVPSPAFTGARAKWEYYAIANRLTVGFDLQYHFFQEGPEVTTVAIPNGAATGPFTRYVELFTALPSTRWFPWGATLRPLRPYVELGAGVTSATGAVLASDLSRRVNTGGFVLQPGAGVLWSLVSRESGGEGALEGDPRSARRSRESMFAIAASLAWAFTTADVLTASDLSYVGIQLGLYSKL